MTSFFGRMMKKNQKQTHYEILRVPMDASPVEIRHAYQDVFEVYQDQSMAANSFFSESERKAILSRLEEAYLVLINPESRSIYDRTLITMGIMNEGKQSQDKSRQTASQYHARRKRTLYQWLPKQPEVDKSVVSENTLIQEILKKDLLTGQDLKKIRMTLGIPLERIVMQTRITLDTLEAIEGDQFNRLPPIVYLKSFLKLYAQCLQIDTNIIIKGYMNHYNTG
jgi:curved DNA-binding protein CbpA